MQAHYLERMKAIVAQAVAEAQPHHLRDVVLVLYGDMPHERVQAFFEEASRNTGAEGAQLHIETAGSRYICWNCCGLRFESADGMCPNCGEVALEVPEEIAFALRRVEVTDG